MKLNNHIIGDEMKTIKRKYLQDVIDVMGTPGIIIF